MQKITPFLWFDNNAEEAIQFYTSIFKDATPIETHRTPDGNYVTGRFRLHNQEFMVINAGPVFKFNESISFFVNCEDQGEVDDLWEKLLADGGKESQCGWLKDRFGLSWQIIPKQLTEMMADKDRTKALRVMQAMMKMVKINVEQLQDAYNGV